uniref:Uncharacterized protein n=1 Tax=Lotus japonicus TaxID=34305 RepID=I3S247_LOTJA|nr:unknown [Lotus japonicus]
MLNVGSKIIKPSKSTALATSFQTNFLGEGNPVSPSSIFLYELL